MGGGHFRIDGGKRAGKGGPQIANHLHAGQDDHDIFGFEPGHDGFDVFAGQGRIHASQAVVGTGFQDYDVGFEGQHPIQARQGAAAGFTANPGIDYLIGVSVRL